MTVPHDGCIYFPTVNTVQPQRRHTERTSFRAIEAAGNSRIHRPRQVGLRTNARTVPDDRLGLAFCSRILVHLQKKMDNVKNAPVIQMPHPTFMHSGCRAMDLASQRLSGDHCAHPVSTLPEMP